MNTANNGTTYVQQNRPDIPSGFLHIQIESSDTYYFFSSSLLSGNPKCSRNASVCFLSLEVVTMVMPIPKTSFRSSSEVSARSCAPLCRECNCPCHQRSAGKAAEILSARKGDMDETVEKFGHASGPAAEQ